MSEFYGVPDDRCPFCWWQGVDSLRADGDVLCEACREEENND